MITNEDKQAIIDHLANTRGYDGEVLEEYEISETRLLTIMEEAGYEKCGCGRWAHEEADCVCVKPPRGYRAGAGPHSWRV